LTSFKESIFTIGIDASNIREGGGFNHLVELLNAFDPYPASNTKIIIWGSISLISSLKDEEWLQKNTISSLEGNIFQRTFWQIFGLSKAARRNDCDVLFVPGGSHYGNFSPVVSMHQNLLPFDFKEAFRFGFSWRSLKFIILRLTQSLTFYRSKGIIFLSEDSKNTVTKMLPGLNSAIKIIPHGIEPRFAQAPKTQLSIDHYSKIKPYKLLYVSTIDMYKHQWNVVEAINLLREEGYPLEVDLVGDYYSPALKKLESVIAKYDRSEKWVHYHGPISFKRLHNIYQNTDLGVLASSCETFSIILLEKMAAGLPIACSNRGPFQGMVKEGGEYFDPESPKDIATTIKTLIENPILRSEKARRSYELSKSYTWKKCSIETINFLRSVTEKET
jgi:glycosyltransferase involved in cell wall biosynthesis